MHRLLCWRSFLGCWARRELPWAARPGNVLAPRRHRRTVARRRTVSDRIAELATSGTARLK